MSAVLGNALSYADVLCGECKEKPARSVESQRTGVIDIGKDWVT
jgi:hypothetical protein